MEASDRLTNKFHSIALRSGIACRAIFCGKLRHGKAVIDLDRVGVGKTSSIRGGGVCHLEFPSPSNPRLVFRCNYRRTGESQQKVLSRDTHFPGLVLLFSFSSLRPLTPFVSSSLSRGSSSGKNPVGCFFPYHSSLVGLSRPPEKKWGKVVSIGK